MVKPRFWHDFQIVFFWVCLICWKYFKMRKIICHIFWWCNYLLVGKFSLEQSGYKFFIICLKNIGNESKIKQKKIYSSTLYKTMEFFMDYHLNLATNLQLHKSCAYNASRLCDCYSTLLQICKNHLSRFWWKINNKFELCRLYKRILFAKLKVISA